MSDSFIEIHDLTTGYTDKHGQRIISRNLNASLRRGKLTCMLGPNGAGKSTLLRTMAAFQAPLAGQVMLEGRDLKTYTTQEIARLISIVLTETPKNMNMNVYDVIALGRSPYTSFWGRLGADDRRAIDESMRLIHIEDFAQRKLHSLSDGERQKVMIAKSITQETPVIFLDEPTAFLDYPSKVKTMLLLHSLTRLLDKTVFLSTHDMEHALWIADEIWLLDQQRGLTVGTPEALSQSGQIGAYFDGKDMTYLPDARRFAITLPEYD